MIKNFVLDTNVVLHDPKAIYQFADNNVVLPIYVLEELDQFKKDSNELGRNARQLSRYLDQYREGENMGRLSDGGIELPNGGHLRVAFAESKYALSDRFHNRDSIDNKILAVGIGLQHKEPEHKTYLVTKDINLRIRADALGLHAVDYEPDTVVTIDELYTGFCEYYAPPNILNKLFDAQELSVAELTAALQQTKQPESTKEGVIVPEATNITFFANQFVQLWDNTNPQQHSAIARVEPDGTVMKPLSKRANDLVWGIRARNKEQRYALSLLLDDRIKLVTLVGKAGTGKTLLAIAAGMQQVLEEEMYQRLLISRPIFPLGRDLGFLPGTMEEKLLPWMQPIFDNVELLASISQDGKKNVHQ